VGKDSKRKRKGYGEVREGSECGKNILKGRGKDMKK
jgi:hypothetical protein